MCDDATRTVTVGSTVLAAALGHPGKPLKGVVWYRNYSKNEEDMVRGVKRTPHSQDKTRSSNHVGPSER